MKSKKRLRKESSCSRKGCSNVAIKKNKFGNLCKCCFEELLNTKTLLYPDDFRNFFSSMKTGSYAENKSIINERRIDFFFTDIK